MVESLVVDNLYPLAGSLIFVIISLLICVYLIKLSHRKD